MCIHVHLLMKPNAFIFLHLSHGKKEVRMAFQCAGS